MEDSNLTNVVKVPHKEGVVIVHHTQLVEEGNKDKTNVRAAGINILDYGELLGQ